MHDVEVEVFQIGVSGESEICNCLAGFLTDLSAEQIFRLCNTADAWLSVDNFLPHLLNYYKAKPGIVIFGQSDPLIFGYPHNTNLLKDRKYLRGQQFWWWEQAEFIEEAFVSSNQVIKLLTERLNL